MAPRECSLTGKAQLLPLLSCLLSGVELFPSRSTVLCRYCNFAHIFCNASAKLSKYVASVDFQSSFIISADFESWKFITHPHRIVVKGSRDKLCSVWAQSLNCWSSNVAAEIVFQVSIKVTPSSVKAHNWLVSFSELTSSNMAGYATVCARFLKEKSFSNFTDFEKAWQNVDVFYISHDLNKQQTDPIGLLFSSSNVLCQKCFTSCGFWRLWTNDIKSTLTICEI